MKRAGKSVFASQEHRRTLNEAKSWSGSAIFSPREGEATSDGRENHITTYRWCGRIDRDGARVNNKSLHLASRFPFHSITETTERLRRLRTLMSSVTLGLLLMEIWLRARRRSKNRLWISRPTFLRLFAFSNLRSLQLGRPWPLAGWKFTIVSMSAA